MNATSHNLQIRFDDIRRRIQLSRAELASGEDVDLDSLGGEIYEASEALRKTPPSQINREELARDLNAVIIDLNSLQQELSDRHRSRGGKTAPDDGTDD